MAVSTTARPVRFLDSWTQAGIGFVVAPLILWGAASVFMLTAACGVPYWAAWIPAVSTSGVMLVTSRLAMRRGLDLHIKRYAAYLAVAAVLIEMVVAGLQHALPETLHAPAAVKALIGALPTAMGGATFKVWSMASAAQDAANVAAQDALDQAALAAETARIETAAQAQRLAAQTAADKQRQDSELAHQRELTKLAADAAAAETARAQAAQSVAKALTTPQRPHLVPDPTPGSTDALGRPMRTSPKRDAALRYLLAQHNIGRDLHTVTAAEVDREIGGQGYARKHLKTWIADVLTHAGKGAA